MSSLKHTKKRFETRMTSNLLIIWWSCYEPPAINAKSLKEKIARSFIVMFHRPKSAIIVDRLAPTITTGHRLCRFAACSIIHHQISTLKIV